MGVDYLVNSITKQDHSSKMPVLEDDFFKIHQLASNPVLIKLSEINIFREGAVGKLCRFSICVSLGEARSCKSCSASEGLLELLVNQKASAIRLRDYLKRASHSVGNVHVGGGIKSWDCGGNTNQASVLYPHRYRSKSEVCF